MMTWKLVIKQTPKLEDLAISTIIKWFISPAYLNDFEPTDPTTEAFLLTLTEIYRNYFSALPRNFHNKLIAEAKPKLSYKANSVYRLVTQRICCGLRTTRYEHYNIRVDTKIGQMIESLFTENITCLEFNDADMAAFKHSFCKFNLMPGLNRLILNCTCRDSEAYILQMLNQSQNLKYFKLCGSDFINGANVLKCIAKYCRIIEKLDLRSLDITKNSVRIFTKLHNLKSIHLDKNLTRTCFETVLLSCKHIENVYVTTMGNEAMEIIQKILSQKKKSKKLIKVKSYSSTSNTTDQMQLLANMCPLIEKIALFDYQNNNIDYKSLAGFKYLTQLHLETYNFYKYHVKEALNEIGHNLISLSFVGIEDMDLNALIHVSQKCPNLESLILIHCTFTKYVPEYDENKLAVRPFRNLKTYLMRGFDERSKPIPEEKYLDEVVMFLLSNCLNVENIKIIIPIKIRAFQAFDLSRLKCLQELEFRVGYDYYCAQILWDNGYIQ